MKKCSECGAEAGDYDRYCTKCGSNFYIECPKCGKQLDKSVAFCSSCGTKCQTDDLDDFESVPDNILEYVGQALLTLFMLDD